MSSDGTPRLAKVHAAGLAVCLALTGAAGALGVWPVLAARGERERRADEAVARERQAFELEQETEALQRRLQEASARLLASAVTLEGVEKLNTRLEAVSKFAEERGLAIENLEPGTPVAEARFVRLPIKLKGSGAYPAAVAFLADLKGKYADVSVRSLKLVAPPVAPAAAAADPLGEPPAGTGDADLGTGIPSERPGTYELELEWFAAPADGAGTPAES